MPDPIQPDLIEPVEVTDEASAVQAALQAAAIEDRVPVPETEPPAAEAPAAAPEGAPPADDTPPAEGDAPPADEPPAEDPPPEELTPEQQDEADAKALGFKNQKANAEFKAQRAELRELRPLKDRVTELERPAQQWEQLTGYFEERQITPEQFGQAMTVVSAFNSTDLGMKRQARDILMGELKNLNAQLGEEGSGFDPLAEPANADIARRVDDGEVSRETALEIARLRHENRHHDTLRTRQAEQTQAQAERAEAVRQAQADLNALGDEYAAIDPHYGAKSAMLIQILKPIFADLPPQQWAAKFRQSYAALRTPPASTQAQPATRRPAPLRNQPLRPENTGAAMQAEIKSEEEAVQAALRHAAQLDGVAYRG